MSNIVNTNIFLKNIIILVFFIILIHIVLNEFLMSSSDCKIQNDVDIDEFQIISNNNNNLNEPFLIKNNNKIENFDTMPSKKNVYLFWASWCGHCMHFKPVFNEFKQKLESDKSINIKEIDCTDENEDNLELMQKFKISGFPSIVIEENTNFELYKGKRTAADLLNYIKSEKPSTIIENPYPIITPQALMKSLEPLIEKSNSEKIKVYNFNTSWCGYSVKFQPIWNTFCDSVKDNDTVQTYDIKCDDENNKNLCNKFNVPGYPSVIIVRNNELIPYIGPRTVNGLNEMVNNIMVNNTHKKNKERIIYNFNTSWCGYSRKFQPVWNTFVNSIKASDNIKAIDVKCDNDENKLLCEKYDIPGFPSIIIVNDSDYELYEGSRTVDDLRNKLRI